MNKIASFTVNHLDLLAGVYVSRKDYQGDVVLTTFDLRFTRPNVEAPMDTAGIHSIEHLMATFLRNNKEWADKTIYFGPMGCQTGFYLLVRDMDAKDVFELTKKILKQTIEHDGDVFGKSAIECGHYENLDIELAKEECRTYLEVLENQTNMEFTYPTE